MVEFRGYSSQNLELRSVPSERKPDIIKKDSSPFFWEVA
jgi:hypothetical protein